MSALVTIAPSTAWFLTLFSRRSRAMPSAAAGVLVKVGIAFRCHQLDGAGSNRRSRVITNANQLCQQER